MAFCLFFPLEIGTDDCKPKITCFKTGLTGKTPNETTCYTLRLSLSWLNSEYYTNTSQDEKWTDNLTDLTITDSHHDRFLYQSSR